MKLNNIKFSKGEEPEEITFTVNIEEALWIAKIAGKQRGSSPHNEIYDCLAGSFFNKFWDSGISDSRHVPKHR